MDIILFAHKEKGKLLRNTIKKNCYEANFHAIHNFNAFKSKLKKNFRTNNNEVLILFAESLNRLKQLISLVDLMEGKRIVLILPDESELTLAVAAQFFPRFFMSVSDDYDNLCQVIGRMTDKNETGVV
jgi:hypothetical protein